MVGLQVRKICRFKTEVYDRVGKLGISPETRSTVVERTIPDLRAAREAEAQVDLLIKLIKEETERLAALPTFILAYTNQRQADALAARRSRPAGRRAGSATVCSWVPTLEGVARPAQCAFFRAVTVRPTCASRSASVARFRLAPSGRPKTASQSFATSTPPKCAQGSGRGGSWASAAWAEEDCPLGVTSLRPEWP
jgi:hypothetical protein